LDSQSESATVKGSSQTVTLLPNESKDTFILYENKRALSTDDHPNEDSNSVEQITTLINENLRKNNSIENKLNEINSNDQLNLNINRSYQSSEDVIDLDKEENIPFKKSKEINVIKFVNCFFNFFLNFFF
jgi:hypothetical protein